MAGIYYFITAVILTLRSDNTNQFLAILVALIFWRWFSKTVDSAPTMISSYAGVLRQTNFSIRLILICYLGTETILFLMNFVVLLGFLACWGIWPHWSMATLLIFMIPQLLFIACFTMAFSIAGTFVEDLSGLLYALTAIWWYMTPGIYSIDLVQKNAPHLLWLYKLNPFAHLVPAYQSILLGHHIPSLTPALILGVCCLPPLLLGLHAFRRARYYYFLFL